MSAKDLGSHQGDTPLHDAVSTGAIHVAIELIEKGADVNVRNQAAYTPLHIAAREADAKLVQLLIKAGADPLSKAFDGDTPFSKAIKRNDIAIIDLLRQALPATEEAHRALRGSLLTVNFNQEESRQVIQYLLEQGANINAETLQGHTPLHKACQWPSPQLSLIRELLESGADLLHRDNEARGAMQLLQDTQEAHEAKGLMQCKRDLDLAFSQLIEQLDENQHNDGQVEQPDKQQVDKIIQSLRSRKIGTPHHLQSLSDNHYVVLLHQARGAHIHYFNELVPLMIQKHEVKKEFLANRLLHWASTQGDLELFPRLLSISADLESQNEKGQTPLILAASAGRTAFVDALIAAGADLNVQDVHGDTALHLASQQGHTETVNCLLSYHADDHLKNADKKTAADLAQLVSLRERFSLESGLEQALLNLVKQHSAENFAALKTRHHDTYIKGLKTFAHQNKPFYNALLEAGSFQLTETYRLLLKNRSGNAVLNERIQANFMALITKLGSQSVDQALAFWDAQQYQFPTQKRRWLDWREQYPTRLKKLIALLTVLHDAGLSDANELMKASLLQFRMNLLDDIRTTREEQALRDKILTILDS